MGRGWEALVGAAEEQLEGRAPLVPLQALGRGNPTCLPQHITVKTRGQQEAKCLHSPHGPPCAPHMVPGYLPPDQRGIPGLGWGPVHMELWDYRPGTAQSAGQGSLDLGKFRNQT